MTVLVTAASRHGGTLDIAAAIRDGLEAAGLKVDLLLPEHVTDVRPYDAVVLGSAVYAGRWLDTARDLADRLASDLADRPLWLFSSGPIGDPPKPTQPPAEGLDIAHRLHAIDHQVFEGRLEREALGMGERAIVAIVGAADGDYRPWEAVQAWSGRIAASLGPARSPQREAVAV